MTSSVFYDRLYEECKQDLFWHYHTCSKSDSGRHQTQFYLLLCVTASDTRAFGILCQDIEKRSDIPRRYLIYFLAVCRYFSPVHVYEDDEFMTPIYMEICGRSRMGQNQSRRRRLRMKKEPKESVDFLLYLWWMYTGVKGTHENPSKLRKETKDKKSNLILSLTRKEVWYIYSSFTQLIHP